MIKAILTGESIKLRACLCFKGLVHDYHGRKQMGHGAEAVAESFIS